MGLTADVELSLRDSGLITFFEENEEAFAEMAAAAYEYASTYVTEIALPVRRDDVAKTLEPALITNEALRETLAERRLPQKYWYRRFADLILDRLWEDLDDEADDEDDDDDD